MELLGIYWRDMTEEEKEAYAKVNVASRQDRKTLNRVENASQEAVAWASWGMGSEAWPLARECADYIRTRGWLRFITYKCNCVLVTVLVLQDRCQCNSRGDSKVASDS